MSKIQLDFTSNPATDSELADSIQQAGLNFKTIQEHGPAGGNPLVELSGPRYALESYINNYCQGDFEFSNYLHGYIR
jgi:hypothetical protein